MVEVEMSVDDHVDILRIEAALLKFRNERRRFLDSVYIDKFGFEFVTHAGFDQDVLRAGAHQYAIQTEANTVPRVGGKFPLP